MSRIHCFLLLFLLRSSSSFFGCFRDSFDSSGFGGSRDVQSSCCHYIRYARSSFFNEFSFALIFLSSQQRELFVTFEENICCRTETSCILATTFSRSNLKYLLTLRNTIGWKMSNKKAAKSTMSRAMVGGW